MQVLAVWERAILEENETSECVNIWWCLQWEELRPLLTVTVLPIEIGLRSFTSCFNKCRTYA